MPRITLLISLFLILNFNSQAQYFLPEQDYALALKNTTLVIELLHEATLSDSLKNTFLKKAFTEQWDYCKIEFAIREEIEAQWEKHDEAIPFYFKMELRQILLKTKNYPMLLTISCLTSV